MTNQEIAAHHESAHALVAHSFGYEVKSIELVHGVTHWGSTWDKERGRLCRDGEVCQCDRLKPAIELVITWAGPLSDEKLAAGVEAFSDFKEIAALASSECATAEAADDFATDMQALARDILKTHWASVEKLAAALLANGSIVEAEEIKTLLGEPANPNGYVEDVVTLLRNFKARWPAAA